MRHVVTLSIKTEKRDREYEVAQNKCTCGWTGPTWLDSYPAKSAQLSNEALRHRVDELEKALFGEVGSSV